MLNARLYRTAWLVAAVALIVALLTLQTPLPPPEPVVPASIDGSVVLDGAQELERVAPLRVAGTQDDADAADWVEQGFTAALQSTGAASTSRVRRQEFLARHRGQLVPMTNVYLSLPGPVSAGGRSGVIVVAPRDIGPGIRSSATTTSLLVELARLSATSSHDRPLLFVSTDGATVGNAGMRWFLAQFAGFKTAAVVVLDGVGESSDGRTYIWRRGRDGRQALAMAHLTQVALERAGIVVAPAPGASTQLALQAVPQSFGDQADAVAAGLPAITISGRPDGPQRSAPLPDAQTMGDIGNAVMQLLGTLDQVDGVAAPSHAITLAGRDLSWTMLRIMLLLVALPVLVAAVDAFARIRRAGVRLGPGVRSLLWRAGPLLVAVGVMHVAGVAGLLPPAAAGEPPLPGEVPFTGPGGLALGIALVAGVVTWRLALHTARRPAAAPAAEAAAGLVALAIVCAVAWLISPFTLLLVLPAAHAVLVATAAPRRWEVAALLVLAVLPAVWVAAAIGSVIDRDPVFSAWYLAATTGEGSRGVSAALVLVAALACLWSMAVLVVLRARKGLVAARPPIRRRPRDRRRPR
ncbi:MAG: hypothetical protein H6531_07375 [Actinobacteria bacterium]|nr:hypothetical protein [Thermoleophilia bacterium]MCB9011636.1 hypothetical protein [Actinomycetota bacterium]